jgi:hypothetical protein
VHHGRRRDGRSTMISASLDAWLRSSRPASRRPGPRSNTADGKTRTAIIPQLPTHQPQLKTRVPISEAVHRLAEYGTWMCVNS